MAWYSHSLGFALPADQVDADADACTLLQSNRGDFEHFVYAPSRNGCLLWRLGEICKQTQTGKSLYLLDDAHLLRADAISQAARQIEALLAEIDATPGLVVEATREAYEPTLVLHVEGFHPQPAERVYGSDVVIRDGWVYAYTEAQVRAFVSAAGASRTPCPESDDDGESLEYVFSFLKSHLALLGIAAAGGMVVVYGETNR